MTPGFQANGFEIEKAVLASGSVEALHAETTSIAKKEGTTCVRGILQKSERIQKLAADHIPAENFIPVRGILFNKTPEENWPVLWHQDLTIAVTEESEIKGYGPWSVKNSIPHVQPPVEILEAMITKRFHLDQTDSDNGALQVISGSHRLGKLTTEEARLHSESGDAFTCECDGGDVLWMSPLILHASGRSRKPGHRRVIHIEYAPRDILDNRLRWAENCG